jgi:phosphoribosyl 1,2-cyclic phosphodiesterase
MITFCPLASGSKGNAVLLKTQGGNLLFDAGISTKALKERLDTIHVSLESLKGILVTHEHHDHIAGIKTLALRHSIPILANYATAEAIVEAIGECPRFTIFTTGEPFEFSGMSFHPFSVQHDGVDPIAFTVTTEGKKIGICTDLGFVTGSVRHALRDCNILYVEANHEPEMVFASSRPEIYKRRVLSRTGHLSNEEAASLVADIAHPGLLHVYLAHLSSECNTQETAQKKVREFLSQRGIDLSIQIAHQHQVSASVTI